MRVSADSDDPGFINCSAGQRYRILCDGREVRTAITADEEQGLVVYYLMDAHGLLILNADGTEALRDELRGCVQIVCLNH